MKQELSNISQELKNQLNNVVFMSQMSQKVPELYQATSNYQSEIQKLKMDVMSLHQKISQPIPQQNLSYLQMQPLNEPSVRTELPQSGFTFQMSSLPHTMPTLPLFNPQQTQTSYAPAQTPGNYAPHQGLTTFTNPQIQTHFATPQNPSMNSPQTGSTGYTGMNTIPSFNLSQTSSLNQSFQNN